MIISIDLIILLNFNILIINFKKCYISSINPGGFFYFSISSGIHGLKILTVQTMIVVLLIGES